MCIFARLLNSRRKELDDGVITKTLASDTIASLSEKEQEELISKLDVTKTYTQKKMQKYIDEKMLSAIEDAKKITTKTEGL